MSPYLIGPFEDRDQGKDISNMCHSMYVIQMLSPLLIGKYIT